METFSNKTQYIPSFSEVEEFFISNQLTTAHAKGWFSKMETNLWLDNNKKKIMNWRKYANYKISDLKQDNSAKVITPKPIIDRSTESTLLRPELKELSESIVNLYHIRTKTFNSANQTAVDTLINNFQQRTRNTPEQMYILIMDTLKQIVQSPGFNYDFLIYDLTQKLKTK